MEREIEFKDLSGRIIMQVERDSAPFDEYILGVIKKDDLGYYRFAPNPGVIMTCKHLRVAAKKVSELNTSGE